MARSWLSLPSHRSWQRLVYIMARLSLQRKGPKAVQAPKASLQSRILALIGFILAIYCLALAMFLPAQDETAPTIYTLSLEKHKPLHAYKAKNRKVARNTDTSASSRHDNTTHPTPSSDTTVTVAYAISLIKCSDFQSSTAGMLDAALVLRHSIHQTSVRNPRSGSRYDYKMYVLVHEQAAHCVPPWTEAGFDVLIRPAPVRAAEIRGNYLRTHIHREWCCGADEFVKLYAYTLPEPLVVHVDIDVAMHRPMDVVYDALLGNVTAQQLVPLERNATTMPWPHSVHAVMTRDWTQVMPGRKAMYQAGFIVLRPSQTVFNEILDVIREGNYVEGFDRQNGWGGAGYGALVGSMAMQGLLAYYYDMKRPDYWMELNQCRFNHLGMDVRYRAPPGWKPGVRGTGKCRNNQDACEDCMITPLADIYNIHFAMCRKPWNCIGEHSSDRRGSNHVPTKQVHYKHCMELEAYWHSLRSDLEARLQELTGDTTLTTGQHGRYMTDVFQGHCTNNTAYLPLGGTNATRHRIPDLYNTDTRMPR